MNYRILLFFFLLSCTSFNTVDKNINVNFDNAFSNSGFAIIYDDKLYKNKIISRKLNDRSLDVFQRNLKKDTFVKITNTLNNKSIIAKVSSNSKYPLFYNSVITKRIAEAIELNFQEPYIVIREINSTSTFVAGKAKTFDEEKEVADKAPVEGITIKSIGIDNNIDETNDQVQKFSYIIKIADFYFLSSAQTLNNRIKTDLNINNSKIFKINDNLFRLYLGPFNNINSLKNAFNGISKLEFENIEIIKQ
tara:strand:- start:362 stop:1108 length:747 start_codon:yes stop_codon:yes gene_type:complete